LSLVTWCGLTAFTPGTKY